MPWETAAELSALESGPVLFKSAPRQIALFRSNGSVYAVDNRCPHEGYPLVQGTVDENCLLTCNWHNWKFRLADGECVLGGDDVRSYPVKVEDGRVLVNTDDPPAEEFARWVTKGLRSAFEDRDFGRICRELTRLHYYQLDPLQAIRHAIEWSHDRLEFGTTHAYAAAADWLTLAQQFPDDWERRLVPLAESIDHIAFDALRHPRFPYADPGEPFTSDAFLQRVEAEDHASAVGMVRRGLTDGLHWADFEEAFATAALAHYNDFGHSLIYVYKTSELIEQLGPEVAPHLLPALARSLAYATREDLIPEFSAYASALAELRNPPENDSAALENPLSFPVTTKHAFAWLQAESPTHCAETLYDALLEVLARNLLHYDMDYQFSYQRAVGDNVGWLDFTHGITFANAVRRLATRYPKLWPAGLLQMACFAGRNRSYLDLERNEAEWEVADSDAFFSETHEKLLDHGLRDPIFSAHLVKTTLAVEEERPVASVSCRRYLLAGLNRFLNSPIKQKHARRLARQAIDLVKRDFS